MTRDDFDHRGWFEQTIQRNAPIVNAAIRWRRSLDVSLAALDATARDLAEAVDAHDRAHHGVPGASIDPRTPGQQATDYGFAAERDRQLVASRAEAKREVERLRGELTRERALVAELKRDRERRTCVVDWQKMAAHLEAERDSLRAKVHGVTAERDAALEALMDARANRCPPVDEAKRDNPRSYAALTGKSSEQDDTTTHAALDQAKADLKSAREDHLVTCIRRAKEHQAHRTKLAVTTDDFDRCYRERAEAVAERDALLVTVRMMARAT